MEHIEFIKACFRATVAQRANAMKAFFTEDAVIHWRNSKEQFTLDDYVRANCEYPGEWEGVLERIELAEDAVITVAKIWLLDKSAVFRVVSFYRFDGDRICELDEYWGDVGGPPQWRVEKHIGKAID